MNTFSSAKWLYTMTFFVVTVLLFGLAGTAFAQLNLVYVETNIGSVPNMNSVAGYSNDGLGNLTALPGSPFLTGGTGVFNAASNSTAYDAESEIIVKPDGSLLLAVNGHTNTVAVFTINSDGSLTPASGSPFSSAGRDPVSLGLFSNVLSGNTSLLTVVNKNNDPNGNSGNPPPGYRNFRLSASGVMTPLIGTAVNLPAGAAPSQAMPDLGAHMMFTDEFMGVPSTITARKMQKTGKMIQVGQVASPDGAVFLGTVLHPTQNVIYAALPATNAIAVLTFDSTGSLAVDSTVADAGSVICWLAINQTGTRLYTGNTMDGTVSVFDTTIATSPVEIQLFQVSGTSPHVSNVQVDPTGQFLYALDFQTLHVLAINQLDGTLSEVSSVALPMPAQEQALGIASVLK